MKINAHLKKFERQIKAGGTVVIRQDLLDNDGDPAVDCISRGRTSTLEVYLSQGWKVYKGATVATPTEAKKEKAEKPTK